MTSAQRVTDRFLKLGASKSEIKKQLLDYLHKHPSTSLGDLYQVFRKLGRHTLKDWDEVKEAFPGLGEGWYTIDFEDARDIVKKLWSKPDGLNEATAVELLREAGFKETGSVKTPGTNQTVSGVRSWWEPIEASSTVVALKSDQALRFWFKNLSKYRGEAPGHFYMHPDGSRGEYGEWLVSGILDFDPTSKNRFRNFLSEISRKAVPVQKN
jgi:hypothetical protein